MNSLIRASALGLTLAAATAATAPAALAQTASAADSMFRATTLNLSAMGEVDVAPDMAIISLGVQTEAATAQEAMQANARQMTQVMAALRRAGIAERDIQTSNLNLSAQYDYQQNEPPRLRGYQASNQVTIKVRDLSRLGAAVDATVSAGANQVNGISFGLNDPAAARNAARQAAVADLRAKAELYAQATGYRVGRLVSLSEGASYSPPMPPMPMMAMARAESFKDSTPVSAGEMTVRVDINALYELTR
ncbi:MAG TPA: SIMPL domain-containing protein [Phenylobacterium sp.]|nr:SIMPL domain-containing protein [Phenylobacterium sp.]